VVLNVSRLVGIKEIIGRRCSVSRDLLTTRSMILDAKDRLDIRTIV